MKAITMFAFRVGCLWTFTGQHDLHHACTNEADNNEQGRGRAGGRVAGFSFSTKTCVELVLSATLVMGTVVSYHKQVVVLPEYFRIGLRYSLQDIG